MKLVIVLLLLGISSTIGAVIGVKVAAFIDNYLEQRKERTKTNG